MERCGKTRIYIIVYVVVPTLLIEQTAHSRFKSKWHLMQNKRNITFFFLIQFAIGNTNHFIIRLPAVMELSANHCRGRPLDFYEQNLVAEYNGVRAGICGLSYKDDDKKFPYVAKDLLFHVTAL